MVLQETIILLSFRPRTRIPEELQKSLFQPFQRGEYAKNINPEGCGLGLSVVKAIMCAHGGDVSYSLTPENGSLFKLSWPV